MYELCVKCVCCHAFFTFFDLKSGPLLSSLDVYVGLNMDRSPITSDVLFLKLLVFLEI